MNNKFTLYKLTLSVLLLLLLTAVSLWPVEVLTVGFPRSGVSPLILTRLPANRILTLRYLHSVEKTPVEGIFLITSDGLFVIQRTRYTSVGTGLPTDSLNHPVREGDWFVVHETGTETQSIRFFIIPENQLSLRLGASDFAVNSIQGRGLLEIEVRQVRLGRWWWAALGNWFSPLFSTDRR